jgi:hypothetical protein
MYDFNHNCLLWAIQLKVFMAFFDISLVDVPGDAITCIFTAYLVATAHVIRSVCSTVAC